jgi:protocatechuate 3,4-dioxygenase beta subunit
MKVRPVGALWAGCLALALAAIPAVAMAHDVEPSPSLAPVASDGPMATPSAELSIAGDKEPGQPLRIAGRVVDAETGAPIDGAQVLVYQTDDGGEYEPADLADESTARLRGEMITAADGRFAFRTILPGEYPDQPPGNRHIHVHSVSADGYAPRGFLILFEHNVRSEVREWARDTGFGQIIELAEEDGLLAGSLEVPLEQVAEDPSAAP